MEKEEIAILAQLLATMKDVASEMERARENKDFEKMEKLKKEILTLQRKAEEVLNE